MSKIQQPPAPILRNTGSAEVAKPATTAKQAATPQPQTRPAARQDTFQATKAAPMELNPAPKAFAQAQAQVGPAGDVLPTGTVANNTPATTAELDKAIDDAFKQQYNGTKTPTDTLRQQWRDEAQKMINDAGGSKEFLAEKIFSALNKAVSSGNGPSPVQGGDNKTPATTAELDKAIDDAFKQQYNGTKTPTDTLRQQWRDEAQKMINDAGGSKEFLAEKIFSALNKAVSSGNGPSPVQGADNKTPATTAELDKAIDDAFKQQYNGTKTPTDTLRQQWRDEAQKMINDAGGSKEFLAEKIFSALNKAVSSGNGPSPVQSADNKTPATTAELDKAIDDAFKQQYNGTKTPTDTLRQQWRDEAQKMINDAGGSKEFLAEKIFSALNKAVSSGNGPSPVQGADNKTPATTAELDKAIDDAFKQQYNGTKTPTDTLRQQWRDEAQKMINDAGGSKEFLAEKIFSALNKAVSSGNGPSPIQGGDNKAEATQQELEAAVKAAFAQQFNGKREPNANELSAWSNKAKDIIKAAGGNKEFLAEKLFTELNKVVSK